MTEQNTKSPGFWGRIWRQFRHYKLGMVGLVIVVVMFLVAFFAPMLASERPILCRFDGKLYAPAVIDTFRQIPLVGRVIFHSPPFNRASFVFKQEFNPRRGDWALWTPIPFGPLEMAALPLQSPSRLHMLGTDEVGRDILSRMIHGTSVSMKVGFISMGIAVLIGLFFGAIAGYAGGWTDISISRFIEIIMCFPTFFLILGILAWFPPRIENVMIVIGLTNWVGIARYARGEIIRLRGSDFTTAARALGAGHSRIIFRHLLPNSLAPVMISVTFGIATAILVEAGLSWLGFGVQPPDPSWGNMLRSGYDNLFTAPHLIPPPCVAIFIAVLAFNLVGDALRDVIDPRLQGSMK
ncbi:ABC transporter permease [bacterium]|nr:ABC transporter permease [bacterium]